MNKKLFFGVFSKMAEKRIFLIFVGPFLNFCKANKNRNYLANFQNFCKIFFCTGPHYVDFAFAFDTTLIRLEMNMAKICSAGVFAPLLNRQLDRVK